MLVKGIKQSLMKKRDLAKGICFDKWLKPLMAST